MGHETGITGSNYGPKAGSLYDNNSVIGRKAVENDLELIECCWPCITLLVKLCLFVITCKQVRDCGCVCVMKSSKFSLYNFPIHQCLHE